ncbi:MAG TPA: amino acid adenylation domain-containing protein, partial [Burkholderiaceae bacterium]|nr:amino acid adenylation domain-containing protein [Burkholderiaceae bacterium]
LRVSLAGDPSTAELLARVQATALAAQEHQDLPFEQLIEALNPGRSLGHSPVFQAMFAWQNAPKGTLELPGLQLAGLDGNTQAARFDIELSMQESEGRIEGAISYATALFERCTVERLVQQFRTLLTAMAADEHVAVARLPLLPAAERDLLRNFNATQTLFPPRRNIHDLFAEQVRRTPDVPALVFGDTRLSYAELDSRANAWAHHLIGMGVGPDARVAICLPRGTEVIVALLAICKAGGACVPLDPDYPLERLAYMLQDCQPQVLITQTGLLPSLIARHPALPLVCVDTDLARVPAAAGPAPAVQQIEPQHLAYILYTSGSTGRPKGLALHHAALINLIDWQRSDSPLRAPARTLQFSALSFDVSFQEVFTALSTGGTLVLLSSEVRQDPYRLVRLLREHAVQRAHMPFVALQAIATAALSSGDVLPDLKDVAVAGEQLQITPAIREFFAASARALHNHYGPTETHVVTAQTLPPDFRAWPVQPGIGRPIANSALYVLDAQGAPQPIGVAGEIHIGGVQVARGYWNRPDLTAERFVPDPFSATPGSRMYRTGDLGRWRIDANGEGSLEFLGRNDHQVKIRGFRIELGEIEAALMACPGVREAVVLAREDEPGHPGAGKRLVAYLSGTDLQTEALRSALNEKLPEYMVPTAYVLLDALPLTPSGKLDRRTLPAPEVSVSGAAQYEAPQGEIECTLAALWCELLGLERVSRADNFFELGGHSLLAVQLASRIRARLGVEVTLAQLFAQPRLAGFAQAVAAASASSSPALVPLDRRVHGKVVSIPSAKKPSRAR